MPLADHFLKQACQPHKRVTCSRRGMNISKWPPQRTFRTYQNILLGFSIASVAPLHGPGNVCPEESASVTGEALLQRRFLVAGHPQNERRVSSSRSTCQKLCLTQLCFCSLCCASRRRKASSAGSKSGQKSRGSTLQTSKRQDRLTVTEIPHVCLLGSSHPVDGWQEPSTTLRPPLTPSHLL